MLGNASFAETEYPACSPSTTKTYGLYGPVKSVRLQQLGPSGRRVLVSLWRFDRSGRLLEDRHRATVDTRESSRPGYQVFRNIYEKQGRDYEIDMFEVDPAQSEKPLDLQRHFVKFDVSGRCIEESDIDSNGKFNGKDIYQYDAGGKLMKEIDYLWDRTILAQQDRSYTPEGKVLSEDIVENPGTDRVSRLSRWYEYDARGNRTDMLLYQDGVLQANWIYKYDDRNRMISSQCIVAGSASL